MRVVIERTEPYSNQFRVWQEGAGIGPMMAKKGARICASREEMIEEVGRLLPTITPKTEKEVRL